LPFKAPARERSNTETRLHAVAAELEMIPETTSRRVRKCYTVPSSAYKISILPDSLQSTSTNTPLSTWSLGEVHDSALKHLAEISAERKILEGMKWKSWDVLPEISSDGREAISFRRKSNKFKTLPTALSFEDLVASVANPAADQRDSSCIIFDWDDTLFPTWYIESVVKPCDLEEDPVMGPLFLEAMSLHVAAVKELLQTARKFARVAIVTLAARPWVHSTAARYWRDFDFEDLLKELEIPVWYARDYLPKADWKTHEEGVNGFVAAKRCAMSRCLKRFNKKSGCQARNIISVGDSFMEHEAMKELVWSMNGGAFCKSILLTYEPLIGHLTDHLRALTPLVGRMVAIQDDFDLDVLIDKEVLVSKADFDDFITDHKQTGAAQDV